MKKMRKLLCLLLSLALCLTLLSACGGGSSAPAETEAAETEAAAPAETEAAAAETEAAETEAAAPAAADGEVFNLRLATHYNTEHLGYAALERIKEKLETESGGRLQITLYPSSQLGDYTLTFQELMEGTIDLALIPVPSEYDSRLEMNFIPYLINGYDGMAASFGEGSYFFDNYTQILSELNIKLLGMYVEGLIGFGFAEYPENYQDVNADKKGLMVRAPAIEVYNLVTEDMGFSATTIPYADLYTSMQTGVCNGWIGGTPQLNYSDFRDVIKYYVPYNVFAENIGFFMSMDVYNTLPEDLQQLIVETFKGESENSFVTAKQGDEDALKAMEEYGIEILPLTDEELQAYRQHVIDTTWPKLGKNIGDDILQGLIEANQ